MVGEEDGEVPERNAHREEDQKCHQRFLPCLRRCWRRSRRSALRFRRSADSASEAVRSRSDLVSTAGPELTPSTAGASETGGGAAAGSGASPSDSESSASLASVVSSAKAGTVPSISRIRSRLRAKPGSRSFQAVRTGEAMKIDE